MGCTGEIRLKKLDWRNYRYVLEKLELENLQDGMYWRN